MVVISVHAEGQSPLSQITKTFNSLRLLLGLGQRRQQQRRQNRDDGDDDQKLNQREGRVAIDESMVCRAAVMMTKTINKTTPIL